MATTRKVGYLLAVSYDISGGCHWYGTINFRHATKTPPITVEYILDAKTARKLSKHDRRLDGVGAHVYAAGDTSTRFIDKSSMLTRAIEIAKENGIDVLFEGCTASCDPMMVLLGPEEFMEPANELYLKAEEIHFWDRDQAAMEVISDQWEALCAWL